MYLDTRYLSEKREELKQDVLDNWNEYQEENLGNEFEQDDFDDAITVIENLIENLRDNGSLDFLINWENEIREIEEINDLENNVDSYSGDNFDDGVTLISDYDFQEYCKNLLEDCGDLPTDLPFYIEHNIDWNGVADDLKIDYSEVEYQGRTYLFR